MDVLHKHSIRKAKPTDAQAIAKVQIAAWQAAYQNILPADFLAAMTIEKCTTNWTAALTTDNPGQYLVVEYNNEIIGFSCFGPARDSDLPASAAELVGINIHPLFWQKQIGSQLLAAIIEQLKTQYQSLYLWVAADNARAIHFYQKHGFVADGEQKNQTLHANIAEIRMKLTL